MVRWVAALALCAGCGRIGFDARTDGSTQGGFGAFGTPVMVTELASINGNISPCISADSLELLWGSTRTSGSYQLWSATRGLPTDPWSNLEQITIPGVTSSSESTLSGDGRELIFRMNGNMIARTTRGARGAAWSTAVPIPELGGFIGPELAGDLRLFVADNLTPHTLYETTRATIAAPFGTPRQLPELVGTANRHFATARGDGLELYFQDETNPNNRIFRVTRPSVDQPFGAPEELLLGAQFDTGNMGDPELSLDGRTLWFVFGPIGQTQIYVTARDPL